MFALYSPDQMSSVVLQAIASLARAEKRGHRIGAGRRDLLSLHRRIGDVRRKSYGDMDPPPVPDAAVASHVASCAKRWARYQRRMERLDQETPPAAHIKAKGRVAMGGPPFAG